ncbi:MAG: hypothetical protein LBM92_00915, partial [Opitutaceae bacterium]|nr:hypothetical protein [Opitutaceae bacterium]
NAVTTKFSPSDTPGFGAIVVSKSTTTADTHRLVSQANGDAVGIVFVRHFFSADFSNVVVLSGMIVCAKSDALRQFAKIETSGGNDTHVLYKNSFQSVWPLPDSLKNVTNKPTKELYLSAWAANNGALLRETLTAACHETAELMHWDITKPGQESYAQQGAEPVRVTRYLNRGTGFASGIVEKRVQQRAWVRTADGCLYAQ